MMFHSFHEVQEDAVLLEYQNRCEPCGRRTGAMAHARQAFLKNCCCKCKRHSWFVRCWYRCDARDVQVLSVAARVAQGTTVICIAHAFLLASLVITVKLQLLANLKGCQQKQDLQQVARGNIRQQSRAF